MNGSAAQPDDDFVHAPDATHAEHVVPNNRPARGRVVVVLVLVLLVVGIVVTIFRGSGPDCEVKTVYHDGPNAFTTYCLPKR